MSTITFEELKQWFDNCNLDASRITDQDEWYIPLDEWRNGDTQNPIALRGPSAAIEIATLIEIEKRGKRSSTQLFSGFRGSGKTTELKRIPDLLGDEYAFLTLSAKEYNRLNASLTLEEMIMIIVVGIIDNAKVQLHISAPKYNGLKRRLAGFGRKIGINDLNLGPLELKELIKQNSELYQRLQAFNKNSPDELKKFFFSLIEATVIAVEPRSLVILIDDIEKYEGKSDAWPSLYQATADLFQEHHEFLRLPACHVVYVVPPFVALMNSAIAKCYHNRLCILHNIRVQRRTGAIEESSVQALKALMNRRVPLKRLFAQDWESCANRLILDSGGHVRDLLELLREVIRRAFAESRFPSQVKPIMPVGMKHVESALDQYRNIQLGLRKGTFDVLEKVNNQKSLDNFDDDQIPFLISALDQHQILYYHDTTSYYDIHPLLRDRIGRGG